MIRAVNRKLAARLFVAIGSVFATMALLGISLPTWAGSDSVEVRSRLITPHFTAYAEVVPIGTTKVRAAETGVIRSLVALPGETVLANQKMAQLQGPEISAQLTRLRTRVHSDRAILRSARQALTAERQKFGSHLTTRMAVYHAKAAVTQASARLVSSMSALQAAKAAVDVVAPVDGVVASLDVSDGDRVQSGQVLLTLQSHGRLWLRARYYGSLGHRIRIGTRGRFSRADGGRSIPVVVVSVGPAVGRGGGLPVRLQPISPGIQWRNGDFGTVRLDGRARHVVIIPTRALILDQGQWWVLLQTPNGKRKQRVTIGASRGFDTEIRSGLKPGARVIVTGAYLDFHQAFAQHYQSPD